MPGLFEFTLALCLILGISLAAVANALIIDSASTASFHHTVITAIAAPLTAAFITIMPTPRASQVAWARQYLARFHFINNLHHLSDKRAAI